MSLQTVTAFMTGHDYSCLTSQNADSSMVLRYSHQTHFTWYVPLKCMSTDMVYIGVRT